MLHSSCKRKERCARNRPADIKVGGEGMEGGAPDAKSRDCPATHEKHHRGTNIHSVACGGRYTGGYVLDEATAQGEQPTQQQVPGKSCSPWENHTPISISS